MDRPNSWSTSTKYKPIVPSCLGQVSGVVEVRPLAVALCASHVNLYYPTFRNAFPFFSGFGPVVDYGGYGKVAQDCLMAIDPDALSAPQEALRQFRLHARTTPDVA